MSDDRAVAMTHVEKMNSQQSMPHVSAVGCSREGKQITYSTVGGDDVFLLQDVGGGNRFFPTETGSDLPDVDLLATVAG
jgi:hypothetical protein